MDKGIVDQLRNVSSIRGKQKTWISELDDEKLYELFSRLKNGDSGKSIAQHCQLTWRIRQDSSVHSLSQGILKFKKRIAPLLKLEQCQETSPMSDGPIIIDPASNLQTNERIARGLRVRIERLMKQELELNIIFPHLNRDVQSLAALEKTILQQKEWIRKHPIYSLAVPGQPLANEKRGHLSR